MLVVGAGPAGSVAALVLARAGVRVGLVDRAAFPRDKLCGDTINPGTLSMLDRLGVGDAVRARARPIAGMDITGPGGTVVSAGYPEGVRGAALLRRHLDMLLVEAATRAGASFESGVVARRPRWDAAGRVAGVVGIARGKSYDVRARLVIAADGRASKIAAAAGLCRFARAPKRWAYGAYYTDVARMTSHGEMHIRHRGYVGVAPLPDGLVNVCLVQEMFPRSHRDQWTPRDAIAEALSENPMLRERFARARSVAEATVLGPLAVDSTGAGCPGMLLAGDAAGFVDPMTGDGLRFAVRGGELAARVALEELMSGSPAHEALRVARAREFTSKWRLNRTLRTLVQSPTSVSVAEQVARRWDAPVRALVRLAGDVHLVGADPHSATAG